MRRLAAVVSVLAFIVSPTVSSSADLNELGPKLKQGGYILVVRHVATDDGQKDAYPFAFNDMKKQRQLSDEGRQVAREMGAAIKSLGVPFGVTYTSKLNRAIETGTLISGAQITTLDELTDSGAGSTSAMANPGGNNAKIGGAIRDLVNKAPTPGTNNLIVTHKTNVADAFGKALSDVREGETLVYKPNPSGSPTLIGRVQASEWIQQAAKAR
jgi:phosphohistidine phosphatase SixA